MKFDHPPKNLRGNLLRSIIKWLIGLSPVIFVISLILLSSENISEFTSVSLFLLILCGLAILIVWLVKVFLPSRGKPYLFTPVTIPTLPAMGPESQLGQRFSQGALKSIIRYSTNVDKRVEAIRVTRQMQDPLAIPLLREAVLDPSDDVRLMAYALLDQKEKDMLLRVEKARKQYSNDGSRGSAKHLAALLWEMAYLGLGPESLLKDGLQEALDLIRPLADEDASPQLLAQTGRIFLALKQPDEANKYFERSLNVGALISEIYPLLAEAYYDQGQWHLIPNLMSQLQQADSYSGEKNTLIDFWCRSKVQVRP